MEHFQRSLTTGNGSFPTANYIKERSLSTRSLVFSAHPWDWLEVFWDGVGFYGGLMLWSQYIYQSNRLKPENVSNNYFFNFSTDTGKRTVYISVKIISEIIVDKQMNSYYNLNKIDPTP